jgi:hypothetical protein
MLNHNSSPKAEYVDADLSRKLKKTTTRARLKLDRKVLNSCRRVKRFFGYWGGAQYHIISVVSETREA